VNLKSASNEEVPKNVTQYALDRVCGRWPQFISRLENHSRKIFVEWEKEIGTWSREDVDRAIETLGNAQWKDRLKGHAPDLQAFVEAKRQVSVHREKGKDFDNYFNFMKRWENRVFELVAIPGAPKVLFDLWMDARMFLSMLEVGASIDAARCSKCGKFAVTLDWAQPETERRELWCWAHSPEIYKNAVKAALSVSERVPAA
jgi:hypothetical protein